MRQHLAFLAIAVVPACSLGPAIYIDRSGDGAGEITSDPEGLHCGQDCAMIVDAPAITLVATAAQGSVFVGWSAESCPGVAPCTLTLARDMHVSARFDIQYQRLAVTRSGSGSGSVASSDGTIDCGTTCDHSFPVGTSVTLTTTPAAGSTFVGWSGACHGTGTCSVTLGVDAAVDAEFATTQPLSVAHDGSGSGTVAWTPAGLPCGTCAAAYPQGTIVTVTATPDSSSVFGGWSGGCSGTGPCVVTMDRPRQVTATFVLRPVDPCTTTITTSEPAPTFNTHLTTAGATICLADGITISGPVVFGANGITVQALGATAHLVNANGDAVALSGHTGITLVGLDISSAGAELTSGLVVEPGASLVLEHSTVHCEAPNCYLVKVISGTATISDSVLAGGSTAAGYSYSYGVYGYAGASVQISRSTISSYGQALNVTVGSSFTVTDSTLRGLNLYTGGQNATITVYNSHASLALARSTVTTYGFAALYAGGAASGVVVQLDDNSFRKAAGLPPGAVSPIVSDRSDTLFQSQLPNTFCNEGTATDDGAFAWPMIAGVYAGASTLLEANQVGPVDCLP